MSRSIFALGLGLISTSFGVGGVVCLTVLLLLILRWLRIVQVVSDSNQGISSFLHPCLLSQLLIILSKHRLNPVMMCAEEEQIDEANDQHCLLVEILDKATTAASSCRSSGIVSAIDSYSESKDVLLFLLIAIAIALRHTIDE